MQKARRLHTRGVVPAVLGVVAEVVAVEWRPMRIVQATTDFAFVQIARLYGRGITQCQRRAIHGADGAPKIHQYYPFAEPVIGLRSEHGSGHIFDGAPAIVHMGAEGRQATLAVLGTVAASHRTKGDSVSCTIEPLR